MASEINEISINNLDSLNKYICEQDNSENFTYFSQVPPKCKEQLCMLGIDEAGRGPVLGPMVYGVAFCAITDLPELIGLHCADSKTLTEKTRDKLFENICNSADTVGWGIEVISPNTICNSMFSKTKCSLNQVSMDSAIGLIQKAIKAGVNIDEIYVDTVGPPDKYQAHLSTLFPNYKITVAKKADSTYPIVSAASICAKVTRDHALSVWNFQEGINASPENFGSGYPGDPVTKQFLTDYSDAVFGYPMLVRFSWATAQTALDKVAYHIDLPDDEELQNAPSDNTAITSFFKSKPKSIVKYKHEFFSKRNLKNIVEF